jgi:hypothetical protein
MGENTMSADSIKMPEAFSLEAEERRILEDIVRNADFDTDQRVLAWAKLKSWGHGRKLACCQVRHLKRDRADVTVLPCFTKEQIPATLEEFVVASQQQCAAELDVPQSRVRAAASRLVKSGFLTTPWVESRAFVTKYKLGKGFQAHLATKHIRAFCPAREVER